MVAKGGSLLLGVGPKPDGELPQEAIQRLQEIGTWTASNGAAIYNTRITNYYHQDNTWFTQNNELGIRFALVCIQEGNAVPAKVSWKVNLPKKGTVMRLLQTGEKVQWKLEGDQVTVLVPSSVAKMGKVPAALAFSFTPEHL